jgi:hypothetical protein
LDEGYCFDDFHARDDIPEDAMFAIEPARFLSMDDEKLTPIRIWSSICHRDVAFFVRKLRMKFIFKTFAINALTTTTCPSRITSLNHKISDNTMKNRAIVVAFFREFYEVFRCLWDFVRKYFESDITMIGVESDLRVVFCHI